MELAGPAGGGRLPLPGRSICTVIGGGKLKGGHPDPHSEGRRGTQERGVNAFPSMPTGRWSFRPVSTAGEGKRYSPNQRRTPLLPRSAAHRPCSMLRREAAAHGTTTPGIPHAVAGPTRAAPPSLRASAAVERPRLGVAVTLGMVPQGVYGTRGWEHAGFINIASHARQGWGGWSGPVMATP